VTDKHCEVKISDLGGYFGTRLNWTHYFNAFKNLSDDRFTELCERYKKHALASETEKPPSPKQLLAFYLRQFRKHDDTGIPPADWQTKTIFQEFREDLNDDQRVICLYWIKRGIDLNGSRWLKQESQKFEQYCDEYEKLFAIYEAPTDERYRRAMKNSPVFRAQNKPETEKAAS